MTPVSETNAATNVLGNLSIRQKEPETKTNELGQTAFLELMITQLNNQDPLSPQENTEFIAQLAQFSSVEGLERLNGQFESFNNSFMSNQALQASSLVGSAVSVETDTSRLSQGGIVSGTAALPQSTSDMSLRIYDESGSLVTEVSLGSQEAGDVVFRWDGQYLELDGELLETSFSEGEMPAGEYRFDVTATQDGEVEQLSTWLSANVNSVTLDAGGGIVLNLAGIGAVDIGDVKQFN